MIVRAATPLMRGAQLTPVRRNVPAPYRGLHLVGRRRPRSRGLGQSETGDQLAAQDLQSYMVGVSSAVEQGTAPSAATVGANIAQDVAAYCAQWPDRCPSGPPDVTALVAQYAQALGSNQQRVATGAAQGTLALPQPTSFYQATLPAQFQAALPAPAPALPAAQSPTSTDIPAECSMFSPLNPQFGICMTQYLQKVKAAASPVVLPTAVQPAQSNAPAPTVAAPIDFGVPVQSNAPATTVVVPGVASTFGWLTDTSIGAAAGINIPNWMWLAGAAAIGWVVFGSKGRR